MTFTIFCSLEARHVSAHTQGSGSVKGVTHECGVTMGYIHGILGAPPNRWLLPGLPVPLRSQISWRSGVPVHGTFLDMPHPFLPTSVLLARTCNSTSEMHPIPSTCSHLHLNLLTPHTVSVATLWRSPFFYSPTAHSPQCNPPEQCFKKSLIRLGCSPVLCFHIPMASPRCWKSRLHTVVYRLSLLRPLPLTLTSLSPPSGM